MCGSDRAGFVGTGRQLASGMSWGAMDTAGLLDPNTHPNLITHFRGIQLIAL